MVWSMVLYFGKKNEKKQNPPTYSLFRQQTYTQRFQNTKHFEARGQPILQSEFKSSPIDFSIILNSYLEVSFAF